MSLLKPLDKKLQAHPSSAAAAPHLLNKVALAGIRTT